MIRVKSNFVSKKKKKKEIYKIDSRSNRPNRDLYPRRFSLFLSARLFVQ